jgi:hypothetical protein
MTQSTQFPKPDVEGSSPFARSDLRIGESNSDYHADKEWLSCSLIKDYITCPSLYHRRHVLGLDQFTSSAMERGTLVHTVLELGKEQSADLLRVAPSEHCTQTGLSQSKKSKEFFAQNPDCIWVSPADGEFLGEVWRQFEVNDAAARVYESLQHKECSIRWTRPDGTKLKCRPDGVTDDGVITDYKTCKMKNPLREFHKNVAEYGYHIQSAMYQEGGVAAGLADKPLIFVLISTIAPYAVQVVRLPEAAIKIGRTKLNRALSDLHAHTVLQHDFLPEGYGEIHTLDMPKWTLKD